MSVDELLRELDLRWPRPRIHRISCRAEGVEALAARYLEEHAAVRLKPGSQTLVEIPIRCHILPALGGMPLAAATPGILLDLFSVENGSHWHLTQILIA